MAAIQVDDLVLQASHVQAAEDTLVLSDLALQEDVSLLTSRYRVCRIAFSVYVPPLRGLRYVENL